MLVKKNGIFTNIHPSEYGIYLSRGFVKVLNAEEKPKEEVKVEEVIVEEEPKVEQEITETKPEPKLEKPKTKKKKV